MKVISQIYEIQTPKEAELMIALGVDHIGSVVLDKDSFKKNQNLKDTVNVVKKNNKISSVIPLFSDLDSIMSLIDDVEPHIIHMCETLAYEDDYKEKKNCEFLYELQHKLKSRNSSLKLMRSIPILADTACDEEKNINRKKILFFESVFNEVSDFFLTDTLFPNGDDNQPVPGFVGITGKICDWKLAEILIEKSQIPVILAGGLSPDNVFKAVKKLQPYGVDSCSNTNFSDESGDLVRFKKDPDKVKKFIEEIRKAENYI